MKRDFAWGKGVKIQSPEGIEHSQYIQELNDCSLQTIAARISDDMCCPIDWSTKSTMAPLEQILLEKWYYIINDELSPRNLDAKYLKDFNDSFLFKPSDHSAWEDMLNPKVVDEDAVICEAKQLASALFLICKRIKKEYANDCIKLFNTKAQRGQNRHKHYVLGAKNSDEVEERTLRDRNEGKLLPYVTCELQELALWQSMSTIFHNRISEVANSNEDSCDHYRNYFDQVWGELFGPKSIGVSVDMLTKVGYYNGMPANWLLFDISFQANEFHCYPELEPSQCLQTCIDDFQGVEECFSEGYVFGGQY